MAAPRFSLALSGQAPNQHAQKEQLEDGINAGFAQLYSDVQKVGELAFNQAQVFDTTAAGLAATDPGQTFSVRSTDPNVAQYVYRHEANGSATLLAATPSVAALSEKASKSEVQGIQQQVDTQGETLATRASEDDVVKAQMTAEEAAYRASLGTFIATVGPSGTIPLFVSEDGKVLYAVGQSGGGGVQQEIILGTDDGQSNAEGAALEVRSVVYTANTSPKLLTLGHAAAADVWLGLTTGGGESVQLNGTGLNAIVPLKPQIAYTDAHGTTAAEGAARWRQAQAERETGQSPVYLVWSNAEGGQSIANLLPTPPAGYFGFANLVTAVTRAAALCPPDARIRYAWQIMAQGESNTTDADLGARHDQYRAAATAAVQPLTGQVEPVRMISFQMSSFQSASDGARSILTYALDHADDGVFFCGGPTYWLPFGVDLLHNSSVGHARRGELSGAIQREVERTGQFLPLHMLRAEVTGANQITVTLSEPAAVETNAVVAALENLGFTATGGMISAVAVSGDKVTLTTAGAASDITAIRAGIGGQASPRTAERIPRTNIRSVASIGAFLAGGAIRKWLCHQQISIS